jgi:hypothetical protein
MTLTWICVVALLVLAQKVSPPRRDRHLARSRTLMGGTSARNSTSGAKHAAISDSFRTAIASANRVPIEGGTW